MNTCCMRRIMLISFRRHAPAAFPALGMQLQKVATYRGLTWPLSTTLAERVGASTEAKKQKQMKTTAPKAHTVHGQPVRLQDTNVAARFASGMRTITCMYMPPSITVRCLPIVCRRNNYTAERSTHSVQLTALTTLPAQGTAREQKAAQSRPSQCKMIHSVRTSCSMC